MQVQHDAVFHFQSGVLARLLHVPHYLAAHTLQREILANPGVDCHLRTAVGQAGPTVGCLRLHPDIGRIQQHRPLGQRQFDLLSGLNERCNGGRIQSGQRRLGGF